MQPSDSVFVCVMVFSGVGFVRVAVSSGSVLTIVAVFSGRLSPVQRCYCPSVVVFYIELQSSVVVF